MISHENRLDRAEGTVRLTDFLEVPPNDMPVGRKNSICSIMLRRPVLFGAKH